MHFLPLLIGSFTAVGIGYFCADFYRNQRRLATKPNPPADWFCNDVVPSPDGDGQAVSHAASQVGHAMGEASQCASSGVEHCIEAIAHSLSHH